MKELATHTVSVRELASLLDRHHLVEIALDSGQLHVRLRREPMDGEVHVPHAVAAAHFESAVDVPLGEAVEAPFTGIFYRSPRPSEPPFVEIGDWIEQGQVVCLIEANKVFSELTSHLSGRISRIVAEDGMMVQPAEPLLYVDPTAMIEQ